MPLEIIRTHNESLRRWTDRGLGFNDANGT